MDTKCERCQGTGKLKGVFFMASTSEEYSPYRAQQNADAIKNGPIVTLCDFCGGSGLTGPNMVTL